MPSVPAAAFFDLDRTLIPGSSGTVFARHLHAAALSSMGGSSWLDPLTRLYEAFGETWLTMQAARLAAGASKGWPVADVRKAAEAAAEELVDCVGGFVPGLLAEHRSEGRHLVMATTTPEALVAPLAKKLGFDAVVATRWATQDSGRAYAGEVDGEFLWGRQKLLAVRRWATEHGVKLRNSYAYSDSYFDGGLLAAVGHPVAVNPDPRLAILARVAGWNVQHLDVSPGVVKVAGRELQHWLRRCNRPDLVPNARFEFTGVDNIPATGGVILVFNHRSYFDSVAVNLLVARSGRTSRFLGKMEVFDAPIIGALSKAFGGIRVVRASGSEEPLDAAAAALAGGEMVVMAPQGTIPRGPAFFDPILHGRWGAAKLAARTKAAVIPVGLWGTEVVWPRNSRLPRFTGSRPLVTVAVGPPVKLNYRSPDADTKKIMIAISALLPAESRVQRTPSDAELAATFPPGYQGDAAQEATRRPGTDT